MDIGRCGKCGMHHTSDLCPDIKMIDYYPDGKIKKVEFYSNYDKRLESAIEIRVKQRLREMEKEFES